MMSVEMVVSQFLNEGNEELFIQNISDFPQEAFSKGLDMLIEREQMKAIPILVKILRAVYHLNLKESVRSAIHKITETFNHQFLAYESKIAVTLLGMCPCKKLPYEVARISGQQYFKLDNGNWWLNL